MTHWTETISVPNREFETALHEILLRGGSDGSTSESSADKEAVSRTSKVNQAVIDLLAAGLDAVSTPLDEAARLALTETFAAGVPEEGKGWHEQVAGKLPEVAKKYEVLEVIGSGGMGEVYRIRDRDRGTELAMKLLYRPLAEQLLCFKSEFRSLCDLSHPNLVRLFEFFHEDQIACLVMEKVPGVNLIDWRETVRASTSDSEFYGRVERVFRQIADGLHYLHCNGKLHRDIKPSNVLVDPVDDRCWILDFGLVTNFAERLGLYSIGENLIAGTVPYMPPEQMSGSDPLSPASDWYAFGVLLNEGLTGTRPFNDTYSEIFQKKLRADPLPLPPGVPSRLAEIVARLFAVQPSERPDYHLIRNALAGAEDAAGRTDFAEGGPPEMLGRESETRILEGAFRKVIEDDECAVVTIHGNSGIGKSTLLESFTGHLKEVESDPDPIVFFGRCYEKEFIPYKGIDQIVDNLAVYLSRKSRDELMTILPPGFAALRRVFPVFEIVPQIEEESAPPPDPSLQWNQMLGSLSELLRRISEQSPLVLVLDDFHWCDESGFQIAAHLIGALRGSRILFVLSYRTVELELNPALTEFLKGLRQSDEIPLIDLPVNELRQDALEQLALRLTADRPGFDVLKMTAESGGSPFFLLQLASAVGNSGKSSDLKSILAGRLSELNQEERSLLELISLAGHPLARGIFLDAANLEHSEQKVESTLRTGHWIKSSGPGSHDTLEAYHDRIRESVVQCIDATHQREYHGILAEALRDAEAREGAVAAGSHAGSTPALIAHHFEEAERKRESIPYWARASTGALQRSAYSEALANAERGLALIADLPEADSMAMEEFFLCNTKATVLISTRGFSSDAVGDTLKRAAGLLEKLDSSVRIYPAICGLWGFTLMRGRLSEAREYAETLIRLAEDSADPTLPIEGYWRMGTTAYWMGNFDEAIQNLEKAVAMYDHDVHASNAHHFAQDPGVAARVYLTFVLCFAGRVGEAAVTIREALEIAEGMNNPHTMAWALGGMTMFHFGLGDIENTLKYGQRTIEYSTEHHQMFWLVVAKMLIGSTKVRTGDRAGGTKLVEEGFKEYVVMGTELVQPFFYALLADCSIQSGEMQQAREQITTGIAIAEKNGEHCSMPGLLIAKASLFLKTGTSAEAEGLLLRAMEMAESQGAKLRALQAAGVLAEWYRKTERPDAAAALLLPVQKWLEAQGGAEFADLAKQFLARSD